MIQKLKIAFVSFSLAVSAVGITYMASQSKGFKYSNADPTSYEVTLDSTNAPSGLTTSFQRAVNATVTTINNNDLTFKLTNAKALDGGYAVLGNYGTVYCITNDAKHISGLTGVNVTFTGGSLKLYSSSVNTTDGSSYVTEDDDLTSGVKTTLSAAANSFVIEAQNTNVSITSIKLSYTCQTSDTAYEFDKVYDVDDFESYSATGTGYDTSHGMSTVTGLRAQYYSTYYGAGSNPTSGYGWNIMGSSDYLTFMSSVGHSGSKTALLKSNSGNYFRYIQAKHYFGVPTAIGKGSKLSVWMHGSYKNTNGEAGVDAAVTLIAFYDSKFNTSGANTAATATYTVASGSDWMEYTVDLDSTKTVYAYGVHIAKASATLYLPIDDVKIYTESPYGAVNVSGVTLDSNSVDLTIGETKALTATVAPVNATDKSITWTTSNSSVASVNQSGVVTANGVGSATITVTTTDGLFTDTCTVNVTQSYPGGTYYNAVTLSGNTIKIEVILNTTANAIVYFHGMKTDGARFTSYNSTTGAFVIEIDGDANLGSLGTYSYGNMTGYYRNDQLENVGLSGSIQTLLGSVNNTITLPHPTTFFNNCDGTNTQLQSMFRRRWRNGSAWAYDDSNSNRITADTVNKASGTNGVAIRPYASGVGIVAASPLNDGNGISLDEANTFCVWIYNPNTVAVSFRIFLYKSADLSSNFEPMSAKSIPAQSWYYVRIGYGSLSAAGTVYNFMITNLGSGSSTTFVIDDVWFHH